MVGWLAVLTCLAVLVISSSLATPARGALVVPTDIQQPGTQPDEVNNLETPDKCDNCHGARNKGVELAHEWRGSMMAHAMRDPIFLATMAIAEQDFDGSGDLCLRCHTTAGWMAGRSTPTDSSGLQSGDADGVECDFCHAMTNPDDSEHLGVQNGDFIANDGGSPAKGYYGSGMVSLWDEGEKLGPYGLPINPPHSFLRSEFHRSVDFCGSCHDVSNPAVGDLAHNNGRQAGAPPVIASGVPGSPVTGKAAFNNFPHSYGVVERTFSEYKSGALVEMAVSDYSSLPPDLKAGAIAEAYTAALAAGTGGNYADGVTRYFSCQTCHMKPTTGVGCSRNDAPTRSDLPFHDMTGGNYWMPQAIAYLDGVDKLLHGGGMSTEVTNDMLAGAERAKHQLEIAASLEDVGGNTVRITNLTGHKLISGYPEGRRMWLEIEWFDDGDTVLRTDGEWGPLFDGATPVEVIDPATSLPVQVKSILDLHDPNTKIYEAHYGLTQEWANQLLGLGYPANLALSYDRLTGAVEHTLGNLASEPPGTEYESFHFVLNNTILKDNRIPTWRMSYDKARVRNALPVPDTQYGNPGPGGEYEHFDDVVLNPPPGAVTGEVDLYYQTTSWEYIQFLHLANDGSVAFLANEGDNILEAWLNTGMSEPYEMAEVTIAVPEASGIWMLTTGVAFLLTVGRRRTRS